MIVDLIRQWFEYDAWANRRVAEALAATPGAQPDAVDKLAHTLAAQELWLRRLRGEDYTGFDPFPQLSLEQVRARIDALAEQWRAWLASVDEARLETPLTYRDTQGGQYRTRPLDALAQLFAHGAYHRGQANLLIRQAGGKPAVSDYMAYVRR